MFIVAMFSQVLDFLFLVGELEDAGYKGDSAETALVACEDSIDKVVLQEVSIFPSYCSFFPSFLFAG